MVCRFNPFYIGPNPPSCCTEKNSLCDCPPCSPDTGYQEPRHVHPECNKGVTERETKESKCNPPCIEAPKEEKSERKHKKEKKEKKDKGEHKDKKEHKHKKENKDKKETQDKKEK